MNSDNIHLIIKNQRVFIKISEYQIRSELAEKMSDEEAYLVGILQKVINVHLPLKEVSVMEKADFVKLGIRLSNILFGDYNIKSILSQQFEKAKNREQYKCRIVLEFDQSHADIATLPWEYLYYIPDNEYDTPQPEYGEFLAADSNRSFQLIRKLGPNSQNSTSDSGPQPNEIELPVKILLVTANPDGVLHMPNLENIIDYFQSLQQAFEGQVQVKLLEQPSFADFKDTLRDMMNGENGMEKFRPDIIHFAGHGKMQQNQGEIGFVKKDDRGKFLPEWVGDDAFANFFDEIQKPYLFFLQICEGAKIVDYENRKGLAPQLLNKGIPAVVALQNPLPEWIARAFVKVVYEKFMKGADIADAVTEGRYHLAKKLEIPDHQGKNREHYGHKSFGSPAIYISTDEPVVIYQEPIVIPVEEAPRKVPVDLSNRARRDRTVGVNKATEASHEDSSRRESPGVSPTPHSTAGSLNEIVHTAPAETLEDANAIRANNINIKRTISKALEELISKVKPMLGNNEVEDAINELLKSLSSSSDPYDKVTNFKGELTGVKDDEADGIISAGERRLVVNRIRNSLFDLLKEIDNRDLL